MKVSIITATCFRPQMFRQMCESLNATTKGYSVEHVVIVDEDPETARIAIEHECTGFFNPTRIGALAAWNMGLRFSSGDIIVPAGDDQLFHEKWLDYALESHREKLGGYGVVGMNDLAYNETQVATMILFDRKYCKEQMGGVIAPPVYEYYCVDSEWNEKAKMLGRFYRDMRAKVEHLHSAHGKRPVDDHDRERMDAGMATRDNALFEERKSLGFPVTWESLI